MVQGLRAMVRVLRATDRGLCSRQRGVCLGVVSVCGCCVHAAVKWCLPLLVLLTWRYLLILVGKKALYELPCVLPAPQGRLRGDCLDVVSVCGCAIVGGLRAMVQGLLAMVRGLLATV